MLKNTLEIQHELIVHTNRKKIIQTMSCYQGFQHAQYFLYQLFLISLPVNRALKYDAQILNLQSKTESRPTVQCVHTRTWARTVLTAIFACQSVLTCCPQEFTSPFSIKLCIIKHVFL